MRSSRRLALRRETLTELAHDDLAAVAGGTTNEVNERIDAITWKYSLKQHCSWTCI